MLKCSYNTTCLLGGTIRTSTNIIDNVLKCYNRAESYLAAGNKAKYLQSYNLPTSLIIYI